MGKYKTFGSRFDRVHRNDLNANFAAVEADINAQKTRVDDLIVGTPQPSEVVDARGGFPVLNDRLADVTTQLAQKASQTEVDNSLALKRNKSTKLLMGDMADEVVSAITGGTTVNVLSVPQDESVNVDKMINSDLMLNYVKGGSSSTLPVKTSGNYEVELNSKDNIYASNGNLIDIVGMQDGTYTANGLTITIVDNRITISGAPTVAQYFKLSGGTAFVAGSTGLNVRNYPLPITDKYTFGGYNIVNTQSPAFTTSIRSTVSGNYAQFNLTDTYPYDELTDLTKFGEVYMYLPAGTYDCAFSLFLIPTAYDVSNAIAPDTMTFNDVTKVRATSKFILSEVAGNAYGLVNVYDNLNVTQETIQQTDQIYVESHTSYFNFYIKGSDKDSNKYLKYTFEYWDGELTNKGKGWVLGVVDAVEKVGDTFTTLYPVVKAGEWEMALRIKGRPDFIGCKQHGSEINFYEKFYIDGTQWTPNESSFYCKEIKVVEKSTMYDPADDTTVVGTHIKDYKLTVDGLKIRQKVLWSTSQIMDLDSYIAMLPIIRGNDATTTYQITAKAYNDDSYEEIDVSNASHGARTAKHEPDKWTLYSNSTGISASIQSVAKVKTAGATSFVQNSASYNKVYFSYCGTDYTVSPGDVWENEITYELNISA